MSRANAREYWNKASERITFALIGAGVPGEAEFREQPSAKAPNLWAVVNALSSQAAVFFFTIDSVMMLELRKLAAPNDRDAAPIIHPKVHSLAATLV